MKIKNIICYFLILFFTLTNLFCQNINSDSIVKKISYYRNINIDSLFKFSKQLENSKNKCHYLKKTSTLAYAYYRKKDYKKSRKYSKILISQASTLLNSSNVKECYINEKISGLNRLFWIEKNEGNFYKAYTYLLDLEKINEEYKSINNIYFRNKLSISLSKSIIKQNLKIFNDAKKILLEAYKDTKSKKFKILTNDYYLLLQKANILNSLGNIYLSLNKKNQNVKYIDSASFYFKKGYEVVKKLNPPHKDSKIIYNLKKTKVLIAKKEYKNALKLINNYKNIHNGFNYNHYEYFQKAVCYFNLKNADSTIFYSSKLLNNKKETCKRSTLIAVYDILSNQYNNLKKLDSAFKYSKLTMEQYELAKKNKEKTFQSLYENDFNKVIKLNEQIKKQSNKKQNYLIIVFSIIVLSLILLGFIKLKIEKKKKLSVINKLNNDTQEKQIIKKEYNIDIELENKILTAIKKINSSNIFLKSDFSVSSITEEINTNSTYVSFIFNKNYKESFKQFYTKKRINYIIDKLKTDAKYKKYSIQALGEEIGYTNASAFSRAFKKQTGLTPSSFLKKLEN